MRALIFFLGLVQAISSGLWKREVNGFTVLKYNGTFSTNHQIMRIYRVLQQETTSVVVFDSLVPLLAKVLSERNKTQNTSALFLSLYFQSNQTVNGA